MADVLKQSMSSMTPAIHRHEATKVKCHCWYSWGLPLIGFAVTFICGVGLSLSNADIRADVQSVGLGLFAFWTLLGLSFTVREWRAIKRYGVRTCLSHAIGGGVCTGVLAAYTATSIAAVYNLPRGEPPPTRFTQETFEPATPDASKRPVWIDADPALILLHGGPGISESALLRHYNAALEPRFLVVYWEQRGAGRSYRADIPPASMTIAQFLRDLADVIANVTIGHQLAYVFALSTAVKREHRRAIAELQEIGPPPHSVAAGLALGRWVERFGGVFHTHLSTGKLIWAAFMTDEASLVDLVKFGRGNHFSLKYLWDECSQVDLTPYQTFDVPIFFLLGRYDWHVPAVLAAQYFEPIRAPRKRLIWFEHAAHNPPFEEPEKFNTVLIEDLLPLLGE
jgi:pimeloyl-ACP methyl ester carboxylesterase